MSGSHINHRDSLITVQGPRVLKVHCQLVVDHHMHSDGRTDAIALRALIIYGPAPALPAVAQNHQGARNGMVESLHMKYD